MRTMALDYGERRIGVAVTDPTGKVALPLETIARPRGAAGQALRRVSELVADYQVGEIVVGIPLHMDGREGHQAEVTRAFGEEVARETGLPVHYLDERWTTREAERVVRESRPARGRGGRRGPDVDPIAAAILLRAHLERVAR